MVPRVKTDNPIADRSIPLAVERWIIHDLHRRIHLRICKRDRTKTVSECDRACGVPFPNFPATSARTNTRLPNGKGP